MQELQGQQQSPRTPSSSYPSPGYPRCCSNSPLQAKGTCSAHSHRSPPCGFGSRSAGRPGEGRGMLRLGLGPRELRAGSGSESPSAPRNCLSLALNRRSWAADREGRRCRGRGAARACPCPEPLPALPGSGVFNSWELALGETSWEMEGAQHLLPLTQETAHFSIILGLHRSNIHTSKSEYKCSLPPQTWLCSPGFTQH